MPVGAINYRLSELRRKQWLGQTSVAGAQPYGLDVDYPKTLEGINAPAQVPSAPHALCVETIMRAQVNRSRSALWICSNALTRRGIYRVIISIDRYNLEYRVQSLAIVSGKCSIVGNIRAINSY